jgi:hypothetical protein
MCIKRCVLKRRDFFEPLFKNVEFEMERQTTLAGLIGRWCEEAIAQGGDDWRRISDHIQSRYAALNEETRGQLEAEAALTLSSATTPPSDATH